MVNRRVFVRIGSAAGLAACVGRVQAGEALTELPTDNPQAVALKYVEDAAGSAPEGQTCTGCMHYQTLDDTWGSCALFPTFKVRAAGWCAGWVAKQ